MPLYEYLCPQGHLHEELRRYRDREQLQPCKTCTAPASYAGMPVPNIGTHRPFGAVMEDGARVRGSLHTAPNKRPVTSK